MLKVTTKKIFPRDIYKLLKEVQQKYFIQKQQ